ncbi:DgyrCDS3999 [Dimorphilus gyrociliatus]|uniref:DgyrCDS3999 n=1 Tax=Dimorphilus gyrociliatus TaxID=2664684 RepID=A0A7I8VFL3_9ANNE|nr:DgyrCDS3999 [Dimorphilus gyrociliatus]
MQADGVLMFILIVLVILSSVHLADAKKNKTKTSRRNKRRGMTTSKFVTNILKGYERQDPPPNGPTNVRLGIYINSFYAISEQTMDYSLNVYLRQNWTDRRLKFKPRKINGINTTEIKLEDETWNKIWIPDVFFRNEKLAKYHDITTPNRLLTLKNSGMLWYVSKITATLSCPMKLHKYPLDTQTCPMMFESFGYTTDTLVYDWLDNPVEMDSGQLDLPQFRFVKFFLKDCSQNYTTGSYPCLSVNFVLKRDIGYYMIQLYIPSVLIVILSWVAFWISIDAIPARVTIGLLTVLTMTTQSTGNRSQLPRVSYIKAIDVWMSMCLIFVFASLLEFAVVNVFSRKEIRQSARNTFRKRALLAGHAAAAAQPTHQEEIALEQVLISFPLFITLFL